MGLTNIPLDPVKTGRQGSELETALCKRIVGQQEAIREIANIYQMYATGMNAPQRPIGSFLFLGPTGSGKTRIVEATAEALLKNARAVTKIDCAEFQHSHEIAKLIGSPPGYLGHRETHAVLSQDKLNQYCTATERISLVLFDEIEKASDALWNLLLGILDKGTLTLGDNSTVDFSRAMIFMTSNLGASEMSTLVNPMLGFAACDSRNSRLNEIDRALSGRMERSGLQAARRKFTPEFINRLDKIITFRPLGSRELAQILDIELDMIRQRLLGASLSGTFTFEVTQTAKALLLRQGTDMKYGARYLKRAIERLIVQPLSNLIATAQIRAGDYIHVDLDVSQNALAFLKEVDGLRSHEMSKMIDQPAMSSNSDFATHAAAQARQSVLSSKRH